MEEESADESETERRGDDAPLPVPFSSLLAETLVSASLADVNGSFGRYDSAVGPACRRPMIGVCDRSYVNSMVRPVVMVCLSIKFRQNMLICLPGSSFLTNNSESEKEEALESDPQPLDGPLADDGGATSEEERVTANFSILRASFQCAP